MLEQTSNTLCPLPWIHLEATQLGEVRPCCMWEGEALGKVVDFKNQDFQNHPILKKVRCQMLQGKRPEGCKKCFLMEDTGDGSPRTHEVCEHPEHSYDTILEDGTIESKLTYTNFRFNAICNLACRMCGPWASTKWNVDFDRIHSDENLNHSYYRVNTAVESQQIYEELGKHLYELTEIHFAGGEPLIVEEHYKILNKLIDSRRSGIKICYNTNVTTLRFKNYDVLSMWKAFVELGNTIQIDLSLDAVGKAAEYIRYGCSWNEVDSVIRQLLEFRSYYPHSVKLFVCPTVSILNVFRYIELFKYCIEVGLFDSNNIYLIAINNYVTSPPWYDLRILPTSQKLSVKSNLEEFLGNYKRLDTYIKSTINFMQGTVPDAKWHEKEFYKYTKRLDLLRNQNFIEVNPEFEGWFNFLDRKYYNEFIRDWKTV